jgi:hypothetical protein
MRTLVACLVAFGCASQSKEAAAPAPAATAMAASMPSNAPQPEPKPAPAAAAKPVVPAQPASAAPVTSGPTTAAEAAAELAAGLHGGGSDAASSAPVPEDEGPCAADADCAFTRVARGACCPMLCTPRVVTKASAQALEENLKTCTGGHECAMPNCRPPRQRTVPACVQSRCTARVVDEKGAQ